MIKGKSYCGKCGGKMGGVDQSGVQVCSGCNAIDYNNPAPVSVCIVPKLESILENEEPKVLVIRRSIEPSKGKWALPGGFVNAQENFEVAAARELGEEIGAIFFDHQDVKLGASFITPSNQTLVFCLLPALEQEDLLKMQKSSEIEAIDFFEPSKIDAFPSHKEYSIKLWEQAKAYGLEQIKPKMKKQLKI